MIPFVVIAEYHYYMRIIFRINQTLLMYVFMYTCSTVQLRWLNILQRVHVCFQSKTKFQISKHIIWLILIIHAQSSFRILYCLLANKLITSFRLQCRRTVQIVRYKSRANHAKRCCSAAPEKMTDSQYYSLWADQFTPKSCTSFLFDLTPTISSKSHCN